MDADQLAREVSAPGSLTLAEIAAAWPEVIDPLGRLDRRKLAAVVFQDPRARKRLEGIMHPQILRRANERATELARAGHPVAFYEASLLVETGRFRELDGLVVVDAPEETRIARVVARDGVGPVDARARISAQLPSSERRRVATYVIENDRDREALVGKVDEMLRALSVAPST